MTKISKICVFILWAASAFGQGAPTNLQSLIAEARQNNAAIKAAESAIQTSEYMPKQASALPDTEVMVQSVTVGSPRPFAGYSNSEFAFVLLYLVFRSVAETLVLIFPTFYAISGGLLLQWLLGYNFSVAVWVGYIALFGIAVETGVVMVVYLQEALEKRIASDQPLTNEAIQDAVIEGAVHRLRPKLMTVTAVLASLVPILWESGIGSDVMKPIAAPIVGGMITSTIHVLILVPVFFELIKKRALRRGTLGQR
jgi:multidrug efflux pump subunit AcrB